VTTLAVQGMFDVYPRLQELCTCLEASIATRGLPPTCECMVMPGVQVAIEQCNPCGSNKCGMAWVRLVQVFPSSVFPVQDVQTLGCDLMLVFEAEVGVVRCAPSGDAQGNPPTKAEYEQAAWLQDQDMMAIRDAVKCCFLHDLTMLSTFTPYGPEGGCVGGSWSVFVGPQWHSQSP